VHRDIKPENVMVRPDGIVKVLDFGLAKLQAASASGLARLETRPGNVPGTIHYISPEQAAGRQVGPPSDIFSWA
jgi:serine/threonine-protein kinase